MNTDSTMEGSARTRNGIARMIFAVLSILLEVAVLYLLFTRLREHAAWIEAAIRLFSVLLVIGIYAQEKTASMKMPWIILIMAFPFVGVFMYLLVGLNGGTWKMRNRYARIDAKLLPLLPENADISAGLAAADPSAAGISSYLKKNSGYPVWQNTDITYYSDAAEGLEAQLKDLAGAREFIFMEYHAIEDKTSWQRIERVLAARAAAGVEVRVFYDDMGSIGFINTDFTRKLRKLGIACRVFNPFAPGLNFFLNNRDHRKITVIDGKVGFTGGYNLADEYFNLTHPYGEWKDTGIRLEGDAVRALTITFLEMWNAVKDGDDDDVSYTRYLPDTAYRAAQTGYVQPYADSPMDDIHVGEDVYISMAEKADRYCYFVTPYLIITDEMTHALALAARRGVDVRIVTPGIPDKKIVYSATRSFYRGLARNGVRIYEWTPGFCHCKMSVADDRMATVGTINMDYRSLYHHFENGCWIYDPQTAGEIRRDFDGLFARSREVTEKYSSGSTSLLNIGQLFLRLIAELL